MDKEPLYMGCIGYSITIYTGWTLSGSALNQLIEHSRGSKRSKDVELNGKRFFAFLLSPQDRATARLSLHHTVGTIRVQIC